ncbi:MAG: hypothetical protein ACI9VI_003181 [Candidatus Azotimanducaceae bacterium]
MWTKALLKTKFKPTAIHLSLSLVIFAALAYLIVFHWYPVPYFEVDGGWQGIKIIALVDLVLGPLITFLIFDPAKTRRAIRFDIMVIAVFQIGALIYGIHTTYSQRPVAIVLVDDYVFPVTSELYRGTLDSTDQLARFSPEEVPIIYAEYPTVRDEFAKVMRVKREQKIPEYAQLPLYRDHTAFVKQLKAKQAFFENQLSGSKQQAAFTTWLEQNEYQQDQILIAKFTGRYGQTWLLFAQDGRYIDYVGF